MAPLEKGGCLDFNLLVHGVSNLRVVDDSVLPNIVSGHTVSFLHIPFRRRSPSLSNGMNH